MVVVALRPRPRAADVQRVAAEDVHLAAVAHVEEQYSSYDVVWAKMTGFPWWPALLFLDWDAVVAANIELKQKLTIPPPREVPTERTGRGQDDGVTVERSALIMFLDKFDLSVLPLTPAHVCSFTLNYERVSCSVLTSKNVSNKAGFRRALARADRLIHMGTQLTEEELVVLDASPVVDKKRRTLAMENEGDVGEGLMNNHKADRKRGTKAGKAERKPPRATTKRGRGGAGVVRYEALATEHDEEEEEDDEDYEEAGSSAAVRAQRRAQAQRASGKHARPPRDRNHSRSRPSQHKPPSKKSKSPTKATRKDGRDVIEIEDDGDTFAVEEDEDDEDFDVVFKTKQPSKPKPKKRASSKSKSGAGKSNGSAGAPAYDAAADVADSKARALSTTKPSHRKTKKRSALSSSPPSTIKDEDVALTPLSHIWTTQDTAVAPSMDKASLGRTRRNQEVEAVEDSGDGVVKDGSASALAYQLDLLWDDSIFTDPNGHRAVLSRPGTTSTTTAMTTTTTTSTLTSSSTTASMGNALVVSSTALATASAPAMGGRDRPLGKRQMRSVQQSQIRQGLLMGNLDPHTMVQCESYPSEVPFNTTTHGTALSDPASGGSNGGLTSRGASSSSQQPTPPFRVYVHPDASFVCDLHAHLATCEVIGFLGGRWDADTRSLFIQAAFPCRSLVIDGDDGSTDVEMDPGSEIELREIILRARLEVVGWYHSHPAFAPDPSIRDIENQGSYQSLFQRRQRLPDPTPETSTPQWHVSEPFVGLIVGTYDTRRDTPVSLFRYFHVRSERASSSSRREVQMPYELKPMQRQYRSVVEDEHRTYTRSVTMYPQVFWALYGDTHGGHVPVKANELEPTDAHPSFDVDPLPMETAKAKAGKTTSAPTGSARKRKSDAKAATRDGDDVVAVKKSRGRPRINSVGSNPGRAKGRIRSRGKFVKRTGGDGASVETIDLCQGEEEDPAKTAVVGLIGDVQSLASMDVVVGEMVADSSPSQESETVVADSSSSLSQPRPEDDPFAGVEIIADKQPVSQPCSLPEQVIQAQDTEAITPVAAQITSEDVVTSAETASVVAQPNEEEPARYIEDIQAKEASEQGLTVPDTSSTDQQEQDESPVYPTRDGNHEQVSNATDVSVPPRPELQPLVVDVESVPSAGSAPVGGSASSSGSGGRRRNRKPSLTMRKLATHVVASSTDTPVTTNLPMTSGDDGWSTGKSSVDSSTRAVSLGEGHNSGAGAMDDIAFFSGLHMPLVDRWHDNTTHVERQALPAPVARSPSIKPAPMLDQKEQQYADVADAGWDCIEVLEESTDADGDVVMPTTVGNNTKEDRLEDGTTPLTTEGDIKMEQETTPSSVEINVEQGSTINQKMKDTRGEVLKQAKEKPAENTTTRTHNPNANTIVGDAMKEDPVALEVNEMLTHVVASDSAEKETIKQEGISEPSSNARLAAELADVSSDMVKDEKTELTEEVSTKGTSSVATNATVGKRENLVKIAVPAVSTMVLPLPSPQRETMPLFGADRKVEHYRSSISRLELLDDKKNLTKQVNSSRPQASVAVSPLSAMETKPTESEAQTEESPQDAEAYLASLRNSYPQGVYGCTEQAITLIDYYRTFDRRTALNEWWKPHISKLDKLEASLRAQAVLVNLPVKQRDAYVKDIIGYLRESWGAAAPA